MKKNLLQENVKKDLITRIENLSKDAPRHWGKMNVNQMLRHCNEGIKIAYGDIISEANKTSGLMQMMMRYFILKTDVKMPKEKVKTFPEIDMIALNIYPENFDIEKSILIESIKNFPIKKTHPVSNLLGKANAADWARLNYNHIDFHLKQFGV